MRPQTVLIGMPSGSGLIPTATVQSLLQLQKNTPCGFIAVERQRVDKARNYMALETLKNGFDYLLMIDDDNPIPPDTLIKFMEDDKDIVSAPILSRTPNKDGVHPLCSFYAEEVEVDGKPLKIYFNITELKKSDGPSYLHKVDATGTGCILIKREVLAKLFSIYGEHIFEFGDIKFKNKVMIKGVEYDRRTMSEDCEFSERAVNAGFEIYLDTRIKPIHFTTQNFVRWGD